VKFLIVGLGSMGKRRIRCLKRLGYNDIVGFDIRTDRREESQAGYGIMTTGVIEDINFSEIDAIIVSTPPDRHNEYIELAIERGKPAFVEASVVAEGLGQLNERAKQNGILIAPSCTLLFHPAILSIKGLAESGEFGKVTNFSYHCGQYLADWHPWEEVKDYYVSKRQTGAAREIVAFELTWICELLGWPSGIKCLFGRTMDVGADIDDTYALSLEFENAYGTVMVDVVSRYATRSLILNTEFAQLLWRWDDEEIRLYDALKGKWTGIDCPRGQSVGGYNKNIIESMYVDELGSFISAVKGQGQFPNTLDKDIAVLKLLEQMEGSYESV